MILLVYGLCLIPFVSTNWFLLNGKKFDYCDLDIEHLFCLAEPSFQNGTEIKIKMDLVINEVNRLRSKLTEKGSNKKIPPAKHMIKIRAEKLLMESAKLEVYKKDSYGDHLSHLEHRSIVGKELCRAHFRGCKKTEKGTTMHVGEIYRVLRKLPQETIDQCNKKSELQKPYCNTLRKRNKFHHFVKDQEAFLEAMLREILTKFPNEADRKHDVNYLLKSYTNEYGGPGFYFNTHHTKAEKIVFGPKIYSDFNVLASDQVYMMGCAAGKWTHGNDEFIKLVCHVAPKGDVKGKPLFVEKKDGMTVGCQEHNYAQLKGGFFCENTNLPSPSWESYFPCGYPDQNKEVDCNVETNCRTLCDHN